MITTERDRPVVLLLGSLLWLLSMFAWVHGSRVRLGRFIGYSACDISAMLARAGVTTLGQALTGGRTGYVAWGATGLILCLLKWRKCLLLVPFVVMVLPLAFPAATSRVLLGFGKTDITGETVIDDDEMTSDRAVVLSPTLVEARLDLASSLYQAGRTDRAEAIHREMLARRPNDVRVLNDLAWILQERRHRYGDALALANEGLGLAPGNVYLLDARCKARALLKLGRVCVKLNGLTGARQHLNDAAEIDREANVLTQDERSEITGIVRHSGA